MRDRALSFILFLLVSSAYYAVASGITASNDGSSYALVRAIVDERRFQIDSFYSFTEDMDAAVRDGRLYSDRPPGTALLAAPFYAVGGYLPHPIAALPSKHDSDNPRLAYLLMLPILAGAGTVVILYRILRSCDLSIFASLTASLAFAFGTINWKYGSALFTHSLSGFLVLTGVGLALRTGRYKRLRWFEAWLLGLVLGLSVLVEYSNALLVVIVLAYLVISLNRTLISESHEWQRVLALAVGLALPVGFLLWYNALNFGSPLTTSYTYNVSFPWARHLATTFSLPIYQGLVGLLWSGPDANGLVNQGVFLLMPITLVSLGGLRPYFKQRRSEALLVMSILVANLLLFSAHRTFGGGSTADGRYLAPFLALWFVPLGYALERLHALSEDTPLKAIFLFASYGLLFLSVRNMLAHIGFSNNYFLDPAKLTRESAALSNWGYILGSIFVNWKNVPLLWMVEAGGLAVFALALWGWQAGQARVATRLDTWMPPRLRQPLAVGGAALLVISVVLGLLRYFLPAYQPAPSSISAAQPLTLRFEGLAEITGIEPATAHARPGGATYVAITWRAIQLAQDSLMVYLHSLEGSLVRFDRLPDKGELLSTDWRGGQTWVEEYIIVIPLDAEAQAVYPLVAGLYDPQADHSLAATDAAGNEVTPIVGRIAINGLAQPFDPAYRFGDVIGLAEPQIARRGEQLEVCLRWLSLAPTSTDYHVFVHVLTDDGQMIAQSDSPPKGGRYPTDVWVKGEAVDDCISLNIGNLPAAGWHVALGLYQLPGGERLPVQDSQGQTLPDGAVSITPGG